MSKIILLLLLINSNIFAFSNQKTKYYTINENGIKATIEYPSTIVSGKKFTLNVNVYNSYAYARMGGFTLSFPQIRYMKGKVKGGSFDKISSYSYPEKIYSGITKRTFKCKYFMVEGWENKWYKNVSKSFSVELLAPVGINHLEVNLRGVLIVGKNKRNSREISIPKYSSLYDQQSYPINRLSIPIITKNPKTIPPIKSNTKKHPKEKFDTTGTGFFINDTYLLTNNHVVNNCTKIDLVRNGYKSNALLTAYDKINDLAILQAEKKVTHSLKFRAGKGIRIGEDIIVIGYPLGDLLGRGIKLTTGNISALTGLRNNTTKLQLTAPAQAGNSGGPLLDKSGNIVGIIVARLKAGQNVNLAIKSNVAQMFLDINDIDYQVDIQHIKKETADIADESKSTIVQVVCHK